MNREELTKTFMMISKWKNPFDCDVFYQLIQPLNPFKPGFTIVIFIHYKPRIAVAILDL